MVMALELSPALSIPASNIRVMENSIFQGLAIPTSFNVDKTRFVVRNLPGKLCNNVVTTDSYFKDGTEIDLEEDMNGLVSYDISNANNYDYPPRFISYITRRESNRFVPPTSVTEVIDCENYESRLYVDNTSVSSLDHKYASSSGRGSADISEIRWNRYLPEFATPNKHLSFPLDNRRSFKSEICEESSTVRRANFLARINDNQMNAICCADSLYCGCRDQMTLNCIHCPPCSMITIKPPRAPVCMIHPRLQVKSRNVQLIRSTKSSTLKRPERSTKKSKLQQKKARKMTNRDLFKSSSFQLYELVFVYPFMDSTNADLSWKSLPKEKYEEVFNILNQVAVGVAGGGLAMLLFVVSKLLCVNATLDSLKLTYLVRGVGLLWLSSGLRKFGSIIKHMADFCEKTRKQKKAHLTQFREQLQTVTFNVCLVLALSVVTLV